jgi:hypothetical protein
MRARRAALKGGAAVVVALSALAVTTGTSYAAAGGTGHTVSETVQQHGTWTEPGDTDFCTGEEVTPTITGNEVMHVTYFPGGDEVWGTFTEEGTGTFTQPSTGLVYSGRVTVWGNFNVNEKNANNTFTATFKLTAVDDQGVTHVEYGHQVAHLGWNAVSETPVVSFEKMNMTCS